MRYILVNFSDSVTESVRLPPPRFIVKIMVTERTLTLIVAFAMDIDG